jgi:hypothetical protein
VGQKRTAMISFSKVEWSEAILVLNFDKNVSNYVGAIPY